jgi:hypothetical protein
MKTPKPWSPSTSLRSPGRTWGILNALRPLQGLPWSKETQAKAFEEVIAAGLYAGSTPQGASLDAAARGRTMISTLAQLGFVEAVRDRPFRILPLGFALLSAPQARQSRIWIEAWRRFELPWRSPGHDTARLRILPAALHLLRCLEALGMKAPQRIAFGAALSLAQDADDIEALAKVIVQDEQSGGGTEQLAWWWEGRSGEALPKSLRDYADTIVRWLSTTDLFVQRGGMGIARISLSPVKDLEIGILLAEAPLDSIAEDAAAYRCRLETPMPAALPWEDAAGAARRLEAIAEQIRSLGGTPLETTQDEDGYDALRLQRDHLLTEQRRRKSDLLESAGDTLATMARGIYPAEAPTAAEAAVADVFGAFDGIDRHDPGLRLDDEGTPSAPAPPGRADLVQHHAGGLVFIVETTLMQNSRQVFAEGPPCIRHLQDADAGRRGGLLVAPSFHRDCVSYLATQAVDGLVLAPVSLQEMAALAAALRDLRAAGRPAPASALEDFLVACEASARSLLLERLAGPRDALVPCNEGGWTQAWREACARHWHAMLERLRRGDI